MPTLPSASGPDAAIFWAMPPPPVTPNYLLAHLVPSGIEWGNHESFISDNSGECWFQIITIGPYSGTPYHSHSPCRSYCLLRGRSWGSRSPSLDAGSGVAHGTRLTGGFTFSLGCRGCHFRPLVGLNVIEILGFGTSPRQGRYRSLTPQALESEMCL